MPVLAAPATPIVSSAWLVEHRASVAVVDTRRVVEYLGGHVSGAVAFPLTALLVEDTSRAGLERLGTAAQQALGARGIGPDSHVVLVDDGDGSASLGAFVCELAGVRAASVLYGGHRSWMHDGGDIDHVPCTLTPVDFDAPLSLDGLATIDEVGEASTGRVAVRLVDARAQLEHEGILGSQCCASRGHIPGSTHLEWTALLGATGDLHDPERILAEAQHVGLSEFDDIVVYCHSGHRAAIAALALRDAGFERVRLSLGSWHEWSTRGFTVAPAR